ncbi:MAG: DMT family transporter [Pseudomonadota bacterium]
MGQKSFALGVASATGVIFIWSGFIVFSRMGVATPLTPFDISALRFLVAGALTAPFIYAWWPRHLDWRVIALMVLCGPGSIYTLIMYFGLADAPAAYAGVFANGSLPIFTIALAAVLGGDWPGPRRLIAIAVIIVGGALVALPGLRAGGPNLITGISLFISASAILSLYIWGIGRWSITPRQALAIVNLPNVLIFLPVWWLALPTGMAEASWFDILFQAAFQGIGPGFFAVILFTTATLHLGATATAGFSAAVPTGAALLAIPVLGETLSALEWGGVALVSAGLILLVIRRV